MDYIPKSLLMECSGRWIVNDKLWIKLLLVNVSAWKLHNAPASNIKQYSPAILISVEMGYGQDDNRTTKKQDNDANV